VPYWACAQVEPQQERAAQHFLHLNGFESYCPRLRITRRSHGRQIVSKPPLFPSYVFIAIIDAWWSARWCPHVVRLILNGTTPAVVPDRVIAEIQSRERNGLVELPARLKPGDRVRVLQGPFTNRVGLFAGMKPHERVEILLQLLGGSQRVTLRADAVEQLDRDRSKCT
jgi:transcriptional antiterminator RfaH